MNTNVNVEGGDQHMDNSRSSSGLGGKQIAALIIALATAVFGFLEARGIVDFTPLGPAEEAVQPQEPSGAEPLVENVEA